MKNIYLIGFMGVGKSTIARGLQAALKTEIIEMDVLIEQRQGMPITQIFETKGEEYFRTLETQLLEEIRLKEGVIVSCGGGVPMRPENVSLMKKGGVVVLLTATSETVYNRVKDGHDRPILNGNMNVEYIAALQEKRRACYEAAADITVATDGKKAGEICEEILSAVNSGVTGCEA